LPWTIQSGVRATRLACVTFGTPEMATAAAKKPGRAASACQTVDAPIEKPTR
jgi:hypothetical protein